MVHNYGNTYEYDIYCTLENSHNPLELSEKAHLMKEEDMNIENLEIAIRRREPNPNPIKLFV